MNLLRWLILSLKSTQSCSTLHGFRAIGANVFFYSKHSRLISPPPPSIRTIAAPVKEIRAKYFLKNYIVHTSYVSFIKIDV